jgi:HK97 family phage prohead protease
MQDNERYDYDGLWTPPPAGPAAPAAAPEDVEGEPEAIEAIDKDGKRTLFGYAVVWGAISSPRRDGFRHRFAKGSITWASPTFALWSHDTATPLGSTANQTLVIEEDDHGAKVTINLDSTTEADTALIRVRDRLVNGMSFGGRRLAYDRSADPKVIDVTAFVADDVSLTIIPAMVETSVVTADQAQLLDDEKKKKGLTTQLQKTMLERIKLSILKPTGRASA